MSETQTTKAIDSQRPNRRRIFTAAAVTLGVAVTAGSLLWSAGYPSLPDLLGSQRALPAGTLHVEDFIADIKNYQGTLRVRGVMAVTSPNDPTLIGLIDSREARVCRDLKCAKNYLPVKSPGAAPKPWDEITVHGKVVTDAKMTYLQAESIENLGSIK